MACRACGVEIIGARRLRVVVALVLNACSPAIPKAAPPILLYSGSGTSPNAVSAVETVLKNKHLAYATANAQQLNAMNESLRMAIV